MNCIISFKKFKEMVAENLGVDIKKLKKNTSFQDDLGVDSLSLVNFVIKLEMQYNIKIEIEKVWLLKNIGKAYEILINKLNMRQSCDEKGFNYNG